MGQSTYIRDGFVSAGNAQVSGSLGVTGTITGNLTGTASYASAAGTSTSASYALTSSYAHRALSSSFSTSASYSVSASYALTSPFSTSSSLSVSASYAARALSSSFSTTASYATQALSASYAPSVAAFPFTGSASISGSLSIIGSGSNLFTVQGSQGELFSITDSLSGSLFSVNDISGLPILEVFSDNTVVMGDYQAPSIYTTKKITANTGVTTIYSNSTASLDVIFVDYVIKSGSNIRAGNFVTTFNGSTIVHMDNSTSDIGATTDFVFGSNLSGSTLIVSGAAATSGWTVKTIIRTV